METPAVKKPRISPAEQKVVDQVVQDMYAANPKVKAPAIIARLRDIHGIVTGQPVIWRRLKALRTTAIPAAALAESDELETTLSLTPLRNGQVRVSLCVDVDPARGSLLVSRISTLLCPPDHLQSAVTNA